MKATCTWGDGPDVLISLTKNDIFVLLEDPDKTKYTQGCVNKGSIGITADEAIELAMQLLASAREAKRLDFEYSQYFKIKDK